MTHSFPQKVIVSKISLFPCWEVIPQTYVIIITIKWMFGHSLLRPLYCSNFLELKQSKQPSYIRYLWMSVPGSWKMISLDDSWTLPWLILRYLWLIGTSFQRSFHGDKSKLTIDTFKDEKNTKTLFWIFRWTQFNNSHNRDASYFTQLAFRKSFGQLKIYNSTSVVLFC